MRSPGINGEGELRGQPANPGSPGKITVKTECMFKTECVMLCVSAVFAVARCPSVSVMLVHCIQLAEDIVKRFSLPGSPMILVFVPAHRTQFSGELLQRGRIIQGGGKILRFSTEIAVFLGNGTK